MKLVVVHWIDAGCEAGWTSVEEYEKTIDNLAEPCVTVGLLLQKGDDAVVIGSGFYTDNNNKYEAYSEVNFIPRGMVKSIKEIGHIDEKGNFTQAQDCDNNT